MDQSIDINYFLKCLDDWAAAHPVRTYAMDFFEKFPNAPRGKGGVPKACPRDISSDTGTNCLTLCNDCQKEYWNRPMPDKEANP
jgi:hypothetical protein